jgi:L-lactate dehydrogenase complex protein LldE
VAHEFLSQTNPLLKRHTNIGFCDKAVLQLKRFVHVYPDAETVVIPSSSCFALMRFQYPGLIDEPGQ